MLLYVLEEVVANGIVVKYCSDNESRLENYKSKTGMTKAHVNNKTINFSIAGLTQIFAIVDDKTGTAFDTGRYFDTQTAAGNELLVLQKTVNGAVLKVDTIQVI